MIRVTFPLVLVIAPLLWTLPSFAQSTTEKSVTTEKFESWILTCVTTGNREACEINQNIADKSGRPLMQLQIGHFNKDGPERSMLARFPVNITTTKPIIWSAGETSIVLTLGACLNAVCVASARISEDVVARLLDVDPQVQTNFTLTQANGVPIAFPLSLTGFADAWNAMVENTR